MALCREPQAGRGDGREGESVNASVDTICKKYVEPRRNDCKGCPIREICTNGPVGTVTLEDLAKHRDRMNKAADAAIKAGL